MADYTQEEIDASADTTGTNSEINFTTSPSTGDTTYTVDSEGQDVNLPNITPADEGIMDDYVQGANSILDTDVSATAEYTAPVAEGAAEGASYIPEEGTVQYQLSQLLNQDSPYMQAVETSSREQANALGLSSSSMAVGAGDYAAIQAGLPIAQQDATTYSNAALSQQNADNLAYTTGMEGQISAGLQQQKYDLLNQATQLQSAFDLVASGLDTQSAAQLQDSGNRWAFAIEDSMNRLDAQLSSQLTTQQLDATTAENVRLSAASLIENNQISIENMLKDPDMLELDTAVLQSNINNMINMTTASVQFLYDSASLNVDGYIGDLLTDLESVIAW